MFFENKNKNILALLEKEQYFGSIKSVDWKFNVCACLWLIIYAQWFFIQQYNLIIANRQETLYSIPIFPFQCSMSKAQISDLYAYFCHGDGAYIVHKIPASSASLMTSCWVCKGNFGTSMIHCGCLNTAMSKK